MRISVDGAGYSGATQALVGGNELAADRFGALAQQLGTYAGMAGDDRTSAEFAEQYDVAAQEAVDGLDDLVDAFATLAGLTGQSHANLRHANVSSVLGHPGSADPDDIGFVAGTIDVGGFHVPSALGANDPHQPAFWNELVDHLEGYAWPNADTDRLRGAATTWRSTADAVDGLADSCDSAVGRLESQDSPEIPIAVQAVRELRGSVVDLAAELQVVADACDEYAATVDEHRAIIEGIVQEMAVEAGVSIVAGAVVGFFTFGGGAAVGGAIAGWRITAAAQKILHALQALHTLAKAKAVAALGSVVDKVRPLRKVLDRLRSAKRLRTGEKPPKPGGPGPHHTPPRKPGAPLDPATRPSTAGSDWEGRVANNGKGDVWQRPGAVGNEECVRIQDPSADYPHGSVRFYNERGQPIDLEGKPTGQQQTHIPMNPDGSYPVPKGWNP